MQLIGVQTGGNGYKLQHIVLNDKGQSVAKNSDIVLWLVCCDSNHTFYFPISKIDLEQNTTIVPSQLYSCIQDRKRSLIKITDTGRDDNIALVVNCHTKTNPQIPI